MCIVYVIRNLSAVPIIELAHVTIAFLDWQKQNSYAFEYHLNPLLVENCSITRIRETDLPEMGFGLPLPYYTITTI